MELKKQLDYGNIKMLVNMQTKQELLEDSGRYFELSGEEIAKELSPHGQVDLMIQEAINLKTEIRNDKIKLIEPRSGTKDRIVVLAYGNYIASLIENEWNKQEQEAEFNMDDFDLVW